MSNDLIRTIRRVRGHLERQLKKPQAKREGRLPDDEIRQLVRLAREHEKMAERYLT